jgi:aspartate/tyrosine/aromatic aminotransferase
VSVQTISGTGANHLGALFLSRFYYHDGPKKVYLSDPTWGELVMAKGHGIGILTEVICE